MALTASSETLEAIWQALNRAGPAPSPLTSTWDKAAQSGWITDLGLEDALLAMDPRLDRLGLKPEAFAKMLGLGSRAIFSRPASRFDDPTGFDSYAAADAAAVLILLERLGFAVDPEPLCRRLRPQLSQSSHLTWQEIDVLFHDKSARRTTPITLAAEIHDWRGMNRAKIKTSGGYGAEYVVGDDGTPLWLEVRAPQYRKRPEPKLTTCDICGVTYVKGLPSDDKEHRATHRRRLAVLEPQPNRRFLDARAQDALQAPWVDARSARWKRDLVYRRAYAFKREMGFDFVQWLIDPAHDWDAEAFLFSDADGRIVGAACFRPQAGADRPWRLDWVWMAPGHRRAGHLGRQWETFRQRYGAFDIEAPVSETMKTFLRARGLDHLLRG